MYELELLPRVSISLLRLLQRVRSVRGLARLADRAVLSPYLSSFATIIDVISGHSVWAVHDQV